MKAATKRRIGFQPVAPSLIYVSPHLQNRRPTSILHPLPSTPPVQPSPTWSGQKIWLDDTVRKENSEPKICKITKRTHLQFFDLLANTGLCCFRTQITHKNEPISASCRAEASRRRIRVPKSVFGRRLLYSIRYSSFVIRHFIDTFLKLYFEPLPLIVPASCRKTVSSPVPLDLSAAI